MLRPAPRRCAFPWIEDSSGNRIEHAAIPQRVFEFGFGFRPNNHQLLKASYKRTALSTTHGEEDNVLALQLVTSVTALTRLFTKGPQRAQ